MAAGSAIDAVRRGRSLAVTIVPPATEGHHLRRLRERPPVATGRVAHGLDSLLDGPQVVDATPHDGGVPESDGPLRNVEHDDGASDDQAAGTDSYERKDRCVDADLRAAADRGSGHDARRGLLA